MRYYVCHVRGGDHSRLRLEGFVSFHPMLDDYVFLEKASNSDKLLRRQSDLGIHCLRENGSYVTVSEGELSLMRGETTNLIEEGSEILVVQGYCSNLEGQVLTLEGDQAKCRLRGYNSHYNVTLPVGDLVKAKK